MTRGKRPKRSTADASAPIPPEPGAATTLGTVASFFDIAKDLKSIVFGVVALLPAGVNEYLLHLGHGIVGSILATVPLTIAFAVMTAALLRPAGPAEGHIALSIGALVAGNLLGFSTGTSGLAEWESGGVGGLLVTLVLGYGRTHGYLAYVAPVVIGATLGWAWRKLRD
jgi:hypothetical protein